MSEEFASKAVAEAFEAFPEDVREGVLVLRDLILEQAKQMPQVGPIEETLKWGQPSYLTPKTKAGSTLRLGQPKTGGFAIYAHCQTSIISSFAEAFPGMDTIEGTRAIHFTSVDQIDPERHALLIRHALGYHLKSMSGVYA